MAVLDTLRESAASAGRAVANVAAGARETWLRATGRTELAEIARAERSQRMFIEETLADLEARMYEPGWQQLTAAANVQFSREGLKQITAICRILHIKNPLIKRGLGLRTAYVWGQGVEISARAIGQDGGQDVNAIVQAFLDDTGNQRALSSQDARETLDKALGTDGNVFFALFTNPRSGRVQVRVLPWDEITDVITNPEDASEPWYYKREWWVDSTDPISGGIVTGRRVAYYPALDYRPTGGRHRSVKDASGFEAEVQWDAPVVHVKVNAPLHWKFGIPDAYAALDWADAYKEFLTDWARLIKALSRFAWRLTTKGNKQAAARAKIAQAPTTDPVTGKPNMVGATALMTPDTMLEAVPKSGATIDSESGRPLAAMVAAALDLPVTLLLGDPGVTGARATAETLDRPTELAMQMRRELWGGTLRTILDYVIDQAIKAPQGQLDGTVTRDDDGREIIELADEGDRTVDISWPDLTDADPETIIKAIVAADQTTYLPPLVVARLLLEALGVRNVDEIIDKLTDDETGEFLPPQGASGQVGQAAVDAFRRGDDAAQLLAGGNADDTEQPGSEEEPDDEDEPPPEDDRED